MVVAIGTATGAAGQAVPARATYHFDIPAKGLLAALADFTAVTGIQIVRPNGEGIAGVSRPVVGRLPAEEALGRLLEGSGLAGRFTDPRTVTLEREPVPDTALTARSRSTPVPPPARDQRTAQAGPEERESVQLPDVTVRGLLDQPYNPKTSTVGSKIDAPLQDIPQSIQVVPRQVMDDQRALTLTDVLRNVSGFSPSVNSQSQRFGDRNVIFRGFTTNNYYTNGFKDSFNGSAFSFGLANVDRVEVLKGPASVLYGLGDPGATINIVTKQPLPDWYAAAGVTAGSYGFVSPTVDVSGPLTPGKAVRFRLTGAYQHQDSFVDFVESERYIVAPVLAFVLGPDTRLTLEGEYQAVTDLYYTGLPAQGTVRKNVNGRIPISRYLGEPALEGTDFPERTLAKVGYRLEHRFNEHVALRHGFRANLHTRAERDVIPFGLQEDERTFDRDLFAAEGWRNDYYALTDVTVDFKTGPIRHQLLVGADQRFLSTRDRSVVAALPPIDVFAPTYGGIVDPIERATPRSHSEQSGTFLGFYLQDLVTLLDQLKLLFGGRYDLARQDTRSWTDGGLTRRSEFDDGVFTPRVGLVYQPVRPVSLYVSYATSFNPVAGTTFDGAAFEPERGVQYEGGVKLDVLGGRLTSTVAIYQLTKENVLTADPDHPGFSTQIGEQRSRGVEVDVAGEILPGLRVIAAYAYTRAKITRNDELTQGKVPANVPTHTGSVWGVYELPPSVLRGLGFGVGVIAVGPRPADNENTVRLPDYVRTDAAIYYRPIKHLDLALNFKNIFDVRYWETSTFADPFGGISPGAPFSVFGTVTVRY
jgi:iron complex outermembrane receptor protein